MKRGTKMIVKITAMMVVMLMLMLNTCVFAQYYKDDATGISLVMSDNWRYYESTGIDGVVGSAIEYRYEYGDNESVAVAIVDTSSAYGKDSTYNTENLSDDLLYSGCEASISNESISNILLGNPYVKSESELTSRETINGIEYFRVEKAFTATVSGYYPYGGYITLYKTIHNGMTVVVAYIRTDNSNHFSDVNAMMQSISFPQNNISYVSPSVPGVISIVMNGEYIYPDSPPIMQNDRVLVPIRAVAEKMGYTVVWNEENESVTMLNGSGTDRVAMYIGGKYCFHNYDMFEMDVVPTVIGDRTYIPLRAAAEAFGANVSWDDLTQTVYISY